MVYWWIQRPHVAEWWHAPTSLAELERDYTMEPSSTRAYIAMLEGEAIGFIQSYVAMDSGDGWWEDERDPGTRGIDQFLANAEQPGRGLGFHGEGVRCAAIPGPGRYKSANGPVAKE